MVTGVYMMMGRALERLSAASAGAVVALRGIGAYVRKSATLTASPAAFPLAAMEYQAEAIVQVQKL